MDALDRQAFEIANDPRMTPDERKAAIDSLYEAPPPPLVDDPTATAQATPVSNANPFGLANAPEYASDVPAPVPGAAPPPGMDPGLAAALSTPAVPSAPLHFRHGNAPPGQPYPPAPQAPTDAAPAGPPGKIMFAPGGPGAPGAAPPEGDFALPAPPPPTYATVGTNTFQPVQRNVQHAVPLDEENEAAQREAETAAGAAGVQAAEADLNARSESRVEHALADQKKREMRELADADIQDMRREMTGKEQAYRDMSEQLARTASEKPFDANRYWANKGIGDKIMSRIAIALGAAGTALTGAPNFAFEEMKQDVANDIEEQKAEHDARVESMGARAKLAGTLYDEAKSRFSDDREARMAALQAAYQSIDAELARFDDGTLDPGRQATLDQMRAQTKQQIAQAQEARRAAHADTITEAQRFDPKRTVQTGGGQMPIGKALDLAAKAEKIHPGSGDKLLRALGYGALAEGGGQAAADLERRHPTEVHDVNGRLLGYARDPRTAAGYTANISAYKSVEKAAQDMIRLQREGGTSGILPTENSHRYKLAKDKLALELGNFYATIGKANLADVEVWKEDLPTGGTLAGNATAGLQQILGDARSALDERLRVGLGAKPPTMGRGAGDKIETATPEEGGTE